MGSTRSSCGAGGASSRSRPAGGCSTTGSSTSSPPSRRSPSCAGATRASTSGSSSISPPTRCPSAATCCPGASSPRWSSPTPSCASCRARSGTPTRRSRSRSARRSAAIRSTRITRAPPSTGGGRCRRCCCPDTTRRSAAGGARAAANVGLRRAAVRYHESAARAVNTFDRPRLLFAMSTVIDNLERAQLRRVPRFAAGDRVRVHFQVIEGTRRRTQVFEGVVIKRQGHGVRETFTVRKQSFGVGVERTFPLHSPKIEKIDVAARGDVRRAKLYYLRERVGKRGRARGGCGRRGRGVGRGRARCRRQGVKTKQRSAGGSLLELVVIVAVALGLALGIQAFLVKPYRIPSESMVPTLEVGQRVLVNRIGHRFSDPKVGDIVVFHPPAGAEQENMCGGGQPPAGQV